MAKPVPQTRAPRIFIGLTEIAGYYGGLAAGLRSLGVRTTYVNDDQDPFRYDAAAKVPLPVRFGRRLFEGRRRARAGTDRSAPAWRAAIVLWRLALLAWAAATHDVFIFGFGGSFLGLRDLSLLKRLGKRVVFVFNGSDARPPYLDGPTVGEAQAFSAASCVRLTARMKRRLATIERHADVIISHPLESQLLERPFASFAVIGLPLRHVPPAAPPPPPDDDVIRILHAPSDPAIKGTARIRAAIASLQAAGLRLELRELSGMPNRAVLEALRDCHFVIDQIYSDAPMVSFAAEAAAFGRPAIIGSYGWDEIRSTMPAAHLPPVEACHPDGLEDAIRHLATDRQHRLELGSRARAFIERSWSPQLVAARYLKLLDGPVPADWLFDPASLTYVWGCGLPAERVRSVLAALVAAGGPAALQVADKPALERRLLAVASEAAAAS